jgi:acyl carrier protein
MMNLHEIENRIRTFLLDSFLPEATAQSFGNDTNLLEILDSLQILRMVITFEGAFGIKIGDSELTPENLGSVRKVAALIARKSGDAGRSSLNGPRPEPDVVDRPRTSGVVRE